MSVEREILKQVTADARTKLVRAMSKQRQYDAMVALRELVGANLPDRHMPTSKVDTVYRKTGGPHVAWKWVTARGMLTLLAEIPRELIWRKVVLTAFVTYPGLSKTNRTIYRNETYDVSTLPQLVEQVVRQFDEEGL